MIMVRFEYGQQDRIVYIERRLTHGDDHMTKIAHMEHLGIRTADELDLAFELGIISLDVYQHILETSEQE